LRTSARLSPFIASLPRYGAALLIVALASLTADVFSRVTGTSRVTSIFLSSVLIAAFYLGVGPGYLAAIVALVAHLYLVDPPYALSLGSIDELNSLLLFLAASVLTCMLAGRVRSERRAGAERVRVSAALLDATREFSDSADEAFILDRLAGRLQALSGGAAHVGAPGAATFSAPPGEGGPLSSAQVGTLSPPWRTRPLAAGPQVFGVAAWRTADGSSPSADVAAALDILVDTAGAALARARLAAEKSDAETRARTEDLRNALLSSISHDLRTPLATILGSATSLDRFAETFDVATRRDLASTIAEEAARLDAFVSNLLHMTRLQAGSAGIKVEPFSLPEAVDLAIGRRRRGGGEVRLEIDGPLPEAMGDEGLFDQAFGNVIENALKYGAGSDVEVRVAREGTRLAVTVADRGPGVPTQDLDRIFEKFFRSSSAGRTVGTGLGLAITRGLVEAMGGQVTASPRAGGGLEVRLILEAADD